MGFIEKQIMERLRELPVEQQREVWHFAEFLHQKYVPTKPYKSVRGLWADLGVDPTEEEIDEARRDLWGISPIKDQ